MDGWMNGWSQTLKHLNFQTLKDSRTLSLGTLNEVKELNGEIPLKYPNRLTFKHLIIQRLSKTLSLGWIDGLPT